MMPPREIIARSWALTKRERQIRRWGLASAFLETLLNTKLFIYQAWFLISYYQGDAIGFFKIETVVFGSVPFWFFLAFIVALIVLVLVELVFPHFALGAIIGLAAKAHRKEEVRGGLVLAIYNFFPIFVAHEILVLASATTTITIISLILRYGELKGFTITVLLTLFVLSNLIKFLACFAEEGIVIRKIGVFAAIGKSTKLVISYIGHIVFIILLLFVITLRILVNVLMLLLLPAIVVGFGCLLSLFLSQILSITIAAVAGVGLIFGASYLSAYLEVFRQTVWTITYLELSALKELDVIEEK